MSNHKRHPDDCTDKKRPSLPGFGKRKHPGQERSKNVELNFNFQRPENAVWIRMRSKNKSIRINQTGKNVRRRVFGPGRVMSRGREAREPPQYQPTLLKNKQERT